MWPAPLQKHLDEYLDQWVEAERIIKLAELITAKAVLPSIQELRYAARRLVDACEVLRASTGNTRTEEQIRAVDTHLIEAIENVIKARHDATDASILFLHKKLNTMLAQFGLELMVLQFPSFSALHAELRDAGLRIVQSRRNRPNLDKSYLDIQTKHLDKLIALNDEMSTSETKLMAMVEAKQKERFERDKAQSELFETMKAELATGTKRERRFNIIVAIISAIFGAVVAIGAVRLDHEIKLVPLPGLQKAPVGTTNSDAPSTAASPKASVQ